MRKLTLEYDNQCNPTVANSEVKALRHWTMLASTGPDSVFRMKGEGHQVVRAC